MHMTGIYFVRVGSKGPALEKFLDIKKKLIQIMCLKQIQFCIQQWDKKHIKWSYRSLCRGC